MKQKTKIGTIAALAFLPLAAFAQPLGDIGDFFIEILNFVNNILIPLVIGIALLVFIYGLYKFFILGGGDDDSRKEGRQLMLYSILAFFLMVTIFAIVDLLARGTGLDGDSEIVDDVPGVQTR
jgi:hypothetical protein